MESTKKHLGFYCSSKSWGGLEMNIGRFAFWMKGRDYPVTMFCLEGSKLAEYCKKAQISTVFVKKQVDYYDLKAVFRVSALLLKRNVEVFLTTNSRDISLTAGVKWRLGKRIITIFFQGMQFGMAKRDILHTYRYRKIDGWLAPLPWLEKQVLSNSRIRKENVFLLPLGIEIEKFVSNPNSKAELRKKFELPANSFLVGIVGRIDAQKGQLDVIKAMTGLPEHVHVLIVGEKTVGEAHEYESELFSFIETNKLEARVHIRSFTDRVEDYFKVMDIFVLASKKETFGLVTIEAMASGIPVVGTNAGGTIEILGKGNFGLLYEPGDWKGLQKKLLYLMDHPGERGRLAVRGQKQAIGEYAHEVMCTRLEEIIDKLGAE